MRRMGSGGDGADRDGDASFSAHLLTRLGFGRLAHNTVLSTFWQFVRVGAQVLWLVVIARSMGPGGYGAFAGIAGLATTLAGLSGLGSGILMVRHVAAEPDAFGSRWRQSSTVTLASGLVLSALFVWLAASLALLHASMLALLLIGLSELVFFPLVLAAGQAFQAHERLGWAGMSHSVMSIARLIAAVAFSIAGPALDLETYAIYHFCASFFATLTVLAIVHVALRPGIGLALPSWREVGEGVGFSASWFTGSGLAELDKTLTLRLAGAELAGIYSAAYRLVSVFTLPVAALTLAAQPRLFRHDRTRGDGAPGLLRHLLLATTVYACLASVALYFLAGILPWLLGPDFEPASKAVRLLVLVPPFFALRLLGSTILMTSGRQLRRVTFEVAGVLLLILLATLWIPKFGVGGAAMSVTVSEGLLAGAFWGLIWVQGRNAGKASKAAKPPSRR